jgi:glycosyltransferase involved in cell wall biosynthesis
MRILRIVSDLYPHVLGGLGVHAHEISRWQSEHGNTVKVLTIQGPNGNGFKRNYQVEEFKCIVKPKGNSIAPSMFKSILQEQGHYDIVHAHSHLFFSTNMGALARRFGRTPLVITNHGMNSANMPKLVQDIYMSSIAKWTFNSAERIICYSKEDAAAVTSLGVDESRVTIIRNGINVNLFTPRERPPHETIQLIWSGRYVPGKGVDILVNAFAIAQKQIPHLRLLLVGDGPQKIKIEDLIARLGIGDKVHMIEYIPNTEMPEIYRNSDICIMTSHYEGIPRTMLESMSCGLPVICTDLPQLRPIVDRCGYLVDDYSTNEFADAIVSLATNEQERRTMGAKGREVVANNYSWDSAMEKTIELYKIIIEEKEHSRAA